MNVNRKILSIISLFIIIILPINSLAYNEDIQRIEETRESKVKLLEDFKEEFKIPKSYEDTFKNLITKGYQAKDVLIVYEFLIDNYGTLNEVEKLLYLAEDRELEEVLKEYLQATENSGYTEISFNEIKDIIENTEVTFEDITVAKEISYSVNKLIDFDAYYTEQVKINSSLKSTVAPKEETVSQEIIEEEVSEELEKDEISSEGTVLEESVDKRDESIETHQKEETFEKKSKESPKKVKHEKEVDETVITEDKQKVEQAPTEDEEVEKKPFKKYIEDNPKEEKNENQQDDEVLSETAVEELSEEVIEEQDVIEDKTLEEKNKNNLENQEENVNEITEKLVEESTEGEKKDQNTLQKVDDQRKEANIARRDGADLEIEKEVAEEEDESQEKENKEVDKEDGFIEDMKEAESNLQEETRISEAKGHSIQDETEIIEEEHITKEAANEVNTQDKTNLENDISLKNTLEIKDEDEEIEEVVDKINEEKEEGTTKPEDSDKSDLEKLELEKNMEAQESKPSDPTIKDQQESSEVQQLTLEENQVLKPQTPVIEGNQELTKLINMLKDKDINNEENEVFNYIIELRKTNTWEDIKYSLNILRLEKNINDVTISDELLKDVAAKYSLSVDDSYRLIVFSKKINQDTDYVVHKLTQGLSLDDIYIEYLLRRYNK